MQPLYVEYSYTLWIYGKWMFKLMYEIQIVLFIYLKRLSMESDKLVNSY